MIPLLLQPVQGRRETSQRLGVRAMAEVCSKGQWSHTGLLALAHVQIGSSACSSLILQLAASRQGCLGVHTVRNKWSACFIYPFAIPCCTARCVLINWCSIQSGTYLLTLPMQRQRVHATAAQKLAH